MLELEKWSAESSTPANKECKYSPEGHVGGNSVGSVAATPPVDLESDIDEFYWFVLGVKLVHQPGQNSAVESTREKQCAPDASSHQTHTSFNWASEKLQEFVDHTLQRFSKNVFDKIASAHWRCEKAATAVVTRGRIGGHAKCCVIQENRTSSDGKVEHAPEQTIQVPSTGCLSLTYKWNNCRPTTLC